jgi:hypothetical protein
VTSAIHSYEVRPRKDHRGFDLISDALPFGGPWYGEPNAISNAIGYAKFYSPPQRFSFFKPRSGLIIRCFAEQPEGGFAFDAAFLSRSLRAKYRIKD